MTENGAGHPAAVCFFGGTLGCGQETGVTGTCTFAFVGHTGEGRGSCEKPPGPPAEEGPVCAPTYVEVPRTLGKSYEMHDAASPRVSRCRFYRRAWGCDREHT